jgi:predicted RNase H-like HicB family nuclease
MHEYHINLFWSDEDKCWIADIPDLKFCSAHGETPDEALREVQIAKKAWLATSKAHKKPAPKPTYRPAIYA